MSPCTRCAPILSNFFFFLKKVSKKMGPPGVIITPRHFLDMVDKEKTDAKAVNWVMTLFESETHNIDQRKEQLERYPEWIKFVAYGVEHTQEGKVHLQAFCCSWTQVRYSQFQSWIGKSYRAPMHGRLVDNENYCSKEGQYTKLGQAPMQGRRTDIIGTKRRLDTMERGQSIMDVAEEEAHHANIAHHHRFYEKYVAHQRLKKAKKDFTKPEVIYIHGPPGCGKDKYVDERFPDNYDVPAADGYKWKDGYNMDLVVVYRNISSSAIKDPNQFLKELDRRVCQCSIKGGFVPWKPEIIALTSVQSPNVMSTRFDDPQEFLRRVTEIVAL